MINRYLEKYVLEDLKEKMAFISGPRQVGKTTFANQIGEKHYLNNYTCLNWDKQSDRKTILADKLPADKKLLIFDEIHKYKKWKNYIKGEYDKNKSRFNILVTGSARLDVYRKGGDSLMGRYHFYRLHPLSLGELLNKDAYPLPFTKLDFTNNHGQNKNIFDLLFKFGGFPEVFIKQNERSLRRWHASKADRLIKEDIRDVENLRDLSALQIMVDLLPDKIGSLFSLNSLREDLEVNHKTITLWANVLEKFFYYFRIYPFQSTLIKALRKEPKAYLWDWSEIKDENIKFENMIASHLLKFCDFLCDVEGYKARLYYIRDKEQREVDFLVCIDNKPWFCAEAKSSSKSMSESLKYFSLKLKIPHVFEVVNEENVDYIKGHIRVIGASKFLSAFV
ncbi:ATP-binding protein [Candidatus Margulisiibacteriota bacterium]